MEIRKWTFEFPAHKGGPQSQTHRFAFTYPVGEASALLTGYGLRYVDSDHEVGQITVQLYHEVQNDAPDGPEVVVRAVLGLRDFSGTWDDRYSGEIHTTLIVERQRRIGPVLGDVPEIEPPIEA
jgi:hypothetical protein